MCGACRKLGRSGAVQLCRPAQRDLAGARPGPCPSGLGLLGGGEQLVYRCPEPSAANSATAYGARASLAEEVQTLASRKPSQSTQPDLPYALWGQPAVAVGAGVLPASSGGRERRRPGRCPPRGCGEDTVRPSTSVPVGRSSCCRSRGGNERGPPCVLADGWVQPVGRRPSPAASGSDTGPGRRWRVRTAATVRG